MSFTRDKGSAPRQQVELVPIVGRFEGGRAQVLRRLERGEALAADEVLLFRFRLQQPAFVYLLAQADLSPSVQVLWEPSAPDAKTAPGEHELTGQGSVLSLDPRLLGGHVRILLLTAPTLMAKERLEQLGDLDNREAILSECSGCNLDLVSVNAAPTAP
ncbi:MAG: hypothetical protein HY901_01710 [Deltaproteobacteria bacterium]|nr:hypothetical protein [Deltaproteobacteria bacterium]